MYIHMSAKRQGTPQAPRILMREVPPLPDITTLSTPIQWTSLRIRTLPMTCQLDRRMSAIARFFSARCLQGRRDVPIGAVVGVLYALTAPHAAMAQEAVMST